MVSKRGKRPILSIKPGKFGPVSRYWCLDCKEKRQPAFFYGEIENNLVVPGMSLHIFSLSNV